MKNKTILIIEDDKSLREIFALVLELDGYRVLMAENGKEALDLLLALKRNELPDCIIVDQMMPVMNGKVFLEILRTSYGSLFNHIPVIVCSAYGEPINDNYIFKKLEKPVPLEEITKTVTLALAMNLDGVKILDAVV